jgi:hypothetical protein
MKPRLYLRLKPGHANPLLIVLFGVCFVMLPTGMCHAAGNGECGSSGVARDESRKE